MKIYLSQLKALLTQKIFPIYLVSGEEPFQKNEAIKSIRWRCLQLGFSQREKFSLEDDYANFHNALYSHTLLDEKRIIEFYMRGENPQKKLTDLLINYSKNPRNDVILLIEMGKLEEKIQKKDWYLALEKIGLIVTIWPVTENHLPEWIKQRAINYGLNLESAIIKLLSELVEGNMTSAANALELLYLLQPKVIDNQLIKMLVNDMGLYSIFDLIDQLLLGNMAKSLLILTHLEEDGIEPTLILWALTRELRLLSELIEGKQRGENINTLFKQHRVFAKRQELIHKRLNHFKANDCYQLLNHALSIDTFIKGGVMGDAWQALQNFCLRWNV